VIADGKDVEFFRPPPTKSFVSVRIPRPGFVLSPLLLLQLLFRLLLLLVLLLVFLPTLVSHVCSSSAHIGPSLVSARILAPNVKLAVLL